MSRYRLFSSDSIIAALPGAESMLWTPARAVMGDPAALGSMMALCVFLLGFVICTFAKRFGGWLIVAVNAEARDRDAIVPVRSFRDMTSGQALRAKEWRLLKRDPWLLSQSLMQILYLIPPAVLLFRNYGDGDNAFVLLAPILVMALGQLAGGLAWLAVSGEDAPDLVATAPVGAASTLRAKVEAVLAIIVAAASPFLVVVAFSAPFVALVTALGIAAAAGSAVAIQLWFQVRSSRGQFRRRQTASKASTFAEAFSSILWAGATCLAAAGSAFSLLFAGLALTVLWFAWSISPSRV
jgi:ABC-2 type transport system permease protein